MFLSLTLPSLASPEETWQLCCAWICNLLQGRLYLERSFLAAHRVALYIPRGEAPVAIPAGKALRLAPLPQAARRAVLWASTLPQTCVL